MAKELLNIENPKLRLIENDDGSITLWTPLHVFKDKVIDFIEMYADALSWRLGLEEMGNIKLDIGERKVGHWICRNDNYIDWLECSECGCNGGGAVSWRKKTNYCPKCGAKMEAYND